MASVLGIGGVFFKSSDPAALTAWYRDVLGLEVQPWGGVVFMPEAMAAHPGAATILTPFEAATTDIEPSTKDYMLNLAVDDLDGMLDRCRANGVEATVLPDAPQGRFAHILDPDGTKIELWQPRPMPA